MIPKTMPQTGRRDEFQRRRHIAHYNLLDKKYQAIKKEHDEIADYVTQQLEAYRNKHGKEMRRVTDEYQRAVAEYEKHVIEPVERINCYNAGKRRALKKKMEPYHKKLALHPGRPMTEDEVFIKDALEERRLQWIKEEEEKPQWVKDLEKCEQEQRWDIITMRENKRRESQKAYYARQKLKKAAQSTTA
jgi:hypothetical protein